MEPPKHADLNVTIQDIWRRLGSLKIYNHGSKTATKKQKEVHNAIEDYPHKVFSAVWLYQNLKGICKEHNIKQPCFKQA